MNEDTDVFPMDDALLSFLEEAERQIHIINAQWQGALAHFQRQHGLKGQWQPGPNRGELVRAGRQIPVEQS